MSKLSNFDDKKVKLIEIFAKIIKGEFAHKFRASQKIHPIMFHKITNFCLHKLKAFFLKIIPDSDKLSDKAFLEISMIYSSSFFTISLLLSLSLFLHIRLSQFQETQQKWIDHTLLWEEAYDKLQIRHNEIIKNYIEVRDWKLRLERQWQFERERKKQEEKEMFRRIQQIQPNRPIAFTHSKETNNGI